MHKFGRTTRLVAFFSLAGPVVTGCGNRIGSGGGNMLTVAVTASGPFTRRTGHRLGPTVGGETWNTSTFTSWPAACDPHAVPAGNRSNAALVAARTAVAGR